MITHRPFGALAVAMCVSSAAAAQDTVHIRGKVTDTAPWVGFARVVAANDAELKTAYVRPEEFVCGSGVSAARRVPPITMDAPPQTVRGNQAVMLTLRAAPPHSGTACVGTIVLVRGTSETALKAILDPYPSLQLLNTGAIQLNLVKCRGWCGAASGITGATPEADFIIQLQNPTRAVFDRPDLEVIATGAASRRQLAGSVTIDTQVPGRFLQTWIRVTSKDLPPDKFSGQIVLSYPGYEETLVVPAEIAVRAAPWLPLLLVILGVGLGQLLLLIDANKTQLDLLSRVNRLLRTIEDLPTAFKVAEVQVRELREKILQNRLSGLDAAIPVEEARVDIARQLYDALLRVNAVDKPDPERHALASQAITDGMHDLHAGKTVEAAAKLAAVRAIIPVLDKPAQAEEAGGEAGASATRAPSPRWPSPQALLTLRMVFQWFLALAVSVIGFYTLYVRNSSFGSASWDYVGLFLWGFTADATSRTLANLGRPAITS